MHVTVKLVHGKAVMFFGDMLIEDAISSGRITLDPQTKYKRLNVCFEAEEDTRGIVRSCYVPPEGPGLGMPNTVVEAGIRMIEDKLEIRFHADLWWDQRGVDGLTLVPENITEARIQGPVLYLLSQGKRHLFIKG